MTEEQHKLKWEILNLRDLLEIIDESTDSLDIACVLGQIVKWDVTIVNLHARILYCEKYLYEMPRKDQIEFVGNSIIKGEVK